MTASQQQSATPGAGFAGALLATARRRAAAEPGWVGAMRARGVSEFARLGLPSRKTEAWKFTDLKALARLDLAPAPVVVDGLSAPLRAVVAAAREKGSVAVVVNGRFRPDLSSVAGLPEGARLAGLAALVAADDAPTRRHLGRVGAAGGRPFLSLNEALMEDGPVLHLAPGTVVEQPIRLLFLTEGGGSPFASFPRSLIIAEPNSAATIIEAHHGTDDAVALDNVASEVVVGDGARLHHYKHQAAGPSAFHVATTLIEVGRDATYDGFALSHGARLGRNEIVATLTAPGSDCRLNGAYLGRGGQHLDTTTLIEHAAPDCRSREVYAGVLDDRARGVFQGKIVVRRGAQRTDGHQLSRALLLSRGAEADSKPELEIYADDVRCSHGSTVGEIDRQALFYLRARGLDEAVARALLVEAFVQEAVGEIAVEAVRGEFAEIVRGWLRGPE